MDAAMALTAVDTLFAMLQCEELRKLCSMLNYKSEFMDMLDAVHTIKTLLRHANFESQELNNDGQLLVDNLKDAVYAAEDLFDEFITIAVQHKSKKPGRILSKKVRLFFSSKKFAYKRLGEIKKLREQLGKIAKDYKDFGFSKLYKPVKMREETDSYGFEDCIIGRDAEKEEIVDLLFKDDLDKNTSFVTIVGIGGLGKTALAQLVFSDHRIKEAFEDNMYWVCVSENFDVKYILGKMIRKNDLEFEDLLRKVRNQIEGKRYFLVLDDVWHEGRMKWVDLIDVLNLGGKGSRILVTSRSQRVATAIGDYPTHVLKGLSEDNSWKLFRIISLDIRENEAIADFDEIGRDIVKKCANVPLSVRVVASLLRGQDIKAWQSYRRIDLAKMHEGEDYLMPILMFSYYHLGPALKSCFSFCSVFPRGHRIDKQKLISLWSAHGYLVPSGPDIIMEDAGERYFSILLHRCFFQYGEKDGSGHEVQSLNSVMHDLARKVVGKESLTLKESSESENYFEGKVRHLFIDSYKGLANWLSSSNCSNKTLRTCLKFHNSFNETDVKAIISNGRRLRVLDLHHSSITRSSLDTLGTLLHLRYLNLSGIYELEMLPKSIIKLHNLMTLIVSYCRNLKELPEDMSKLINLRVLDIDGCVSLTHMPERMDRLTTLHTLSMFVVPRDMSNSKKNKIGSLIDLKALVNNLRGRLHVVHDASTSDSGIAILESSNLNFRFQLLDNKAGHKKLLESLFPNIHEPTKIKISGYADTELPSWVPVKGTCYSRLVSLDLIQCNELQYLPSSLSELSDLKYLQLIRMDNLEYIERSAPSPSLTYFPSLEKLELRRIPKLRGWWRDVRWMENGEGGGCLVDENEQAVFLPSFRKLHVLTIHECENLICFPPCPYVKELNLYDLNEGLTFCMKGGAVQSSGSLEMLSIYNSCGLLYSLSREFVGSTTRMTFGASEDLGGMREGFQGWASSLQELEITHANLGVLEGMPWESFPSLSSLKIQNTMPEVVILPREIQLLTSLKSLSLINCNKLKALGEGVNSLASLQVLELDSCPNLESLPEEMHCLISLTTLEIQHCPKLTSLPEAMRHLTSLTTLTIRGHCHKLKLRCRQQDGEDWHKISHISDIQIS